MKTTQGYANSLRLVLANVGLAGNKLEEMLALANPEAAASVGRAERERLLRAAADHLSKQLQRQGTLEVQLERIRGDLVIQKRAAALVVANQKDPDQPKPSDKAKQQLVDAIKRLNDAAEAAETELAGVKTAVELLKHMVEQRADAVQSFDAEANSARHRIDMANLRKGQAEMNAEIAGMARDGGSTTGLSALNRAAEKAEQEAHAAEIVGRATSTNPSDDAVMAQILAEAAGKDKKPVDDVLAELAK